MERSKTLYRQDLDHQGFENIIYQNGLKFKLERAIYCPCRRTDNGAPQSVCTNCNGSGWLFTEPNEILGMVTSLNYEQVIQMSFPEITATANLTLSEVNDFRLTYFDKLTMVDGSGVIMNNVKQFRLIPNTYNKKTFQLSLPYRIVDIEYLVLYISSSAVKKLVRTDFMITPETNLIELSDSMTKYLTNLNMVDVMASIRYYHMPIYHVVRQEHSIRLSHVIDQGTEVVQKFPLQYMIREHNFFVENGLAI